MDSLVLAGRFLDPVSLLIVFGGAGAMAALRSTRSDLARALAALRPLVRARPEEEAQAARVAINSIRRIAEKKGTACADRVASAELFVRRAARRLSDSASPKAFAAWGADELATREARHAAVHGVWRAVADAAPAMGMIGTIVGLIQMFAHMDDPAKIGPGMAIALLTTLYGVILANVIAGPIAARLERLSAVELGWQRDALAKLETIARDEAASLPRPAPIRSVA